ncbi:hypothetical protein MBLNU459_g6592t1 [Dothideomycetes sp. NU459]
MSSSKLDQSLEEIAGSRRVNARRGRRAGAKPAAPRVSGGVSKNTAPKATKPAAPRTGKPAAPLPQLTGESKIIVSNLPADVTEQQIKEYFSKSVGAVKKVLLNYNKTGRSVGVATIIFQQPNSAAEAAKTYDGVKVDGKPMKIEVILGAKFAPEPAKPKALGERISQPKKDAAKPKSAAAAPKNAAKAGANGATTAGARGGRGGRKGRAAGRPKPKSVEELDAEMSEYFVPSGTNGDAAATTANGNAATAAAPTAGDAAMEDEIM